MKKPLDIKTLLKILFITLLVTTITIQPLSAIQADETNNQPNHPREMNHKDLASGKIYSSLETPKDSPYKVGKVIGIVKHPYGLVKEMLIDFSDYENIFERVFHSEWVEKKETFAIVYGELDVPIVKDRWFLLNVDLKNDGKEAVVKWKNNYDPILLGKYVKANEGRGLYHLRENYGNLRIEPFNIEGQKEPVALVSFEIFVYAPTTKWGWLLNFLSSFALPGIIEDIRKTADKRFK